MQETQILQQRHDDAAHEILHEMQGFFEHYFELQIQNDIEKAYPVAIDRLLHYASVCAHSDRLTVNATTLASIVFTHYLKKVPSTDLFANYAAYHMMKADNCFQLVQELTIDGKRSLPKESRGPKAYCLGALRAMFIEQTTKLCAQAHKWSNFDVGKLIEPFKRLYLSLARDMAVKSANQNHFVLFKEYIFSSGKPLTNIDHKKAKRLLYKAIRARCQTEQNFIEYVQPSFGTPAAPDPSLPVAADPRTAFQIIRHLPYRDVVRLSRTSKTWNRIFHAANAQYWCTLYRNRYFRFIPVAKPPPTTWHRLVMYLEYRGRNESIQHLFERLKVPVPERCPARIRHAFYLQTKEVQALWNRTMRPSDATTKRKPTAPE